MILLITRKDTAYDLSVASQILLIISIRDQILMIVYVTGRDIVTALFDIEVRSYCQIRDNDRVLRRYAVDRAASAGG